MRHASRTDANQPAIIDALRRIGCQVYYIKLPTDLIVSGGPLGNANLLMEIKMAGEDLNGLQKMFWMRWPGRKCVVRSVAEALREVIGPEAMK